MTWKNVTSYSQGDVLREPRTWELTVTPDVRICVTKGHRYYEPEQWIMHCDPWFDMHLLWAATTAHEAQQIAIGKVRARLKAAYDAICKVGPPEERPEPSIADQPAMVSRA